MGKKRGGAGDRGRRLLKKISVPMDHFTLVNQIARGNISQPISARNTPQPIRGCTIMRPKPISRKKTSANQREEHIQANQREEHIPANQRLYILLRPKPIRARNTSQPISARNTSQPISVRNKS